MSIEHPKWFCLHCRGGDRYDLFTCVTMPAGTSADIVNGGHRATVRGSGPEDVPYDGRSPNERDFDRRHGSWPGCKCTGLARRRHTQGEHLLFAFGCLFVSRGGKWHVVETY
jgi:hypothetical protein